MDELKCYGLPSDKKDEFIKAITANELEYDKNSGNILSGKDGYHLVIGKIPDTLPIMLVEKSRPGFHNKNFNKEISRLVQLAQEFKIN